MNGESKEPGELKEIEEQVGRSEKKEKPVETAKEMVNPDAKELERKVAALERQVETKSGVIAGLEEQLARLSQDFEGARAAYSYAVEDYKRLVLQSNPLVPADYISGTTIEEVKSSVARALSLVASVKEALMKQSQSTSVPAGAPARTGPETSAMSAKEKINYGLEKARRQKE